MTFEPKDPRFDARVRETFAAQGMMQTLGMSILTLEPGLVELEMEFQDRFTQQHGFHHAGVATTGMDTACGFAALSLMDIGAEVLTVEFKSSFLAPARGAAFRFKGCVVKPGQTLHFCEGEAFSLEGDAPKTIATMSATMMALSKRQTASG